MPALKFNDGGKSYGSSVLTLKKWNGATYVARGSYATDDFSWDKNTNRTEFTNSDQIPTGRVLVHGGNSGRATLQLASAATALPGQFDVFRWTDPEGVNFYFVVENVGKSERKGDEAKVPVTFVQVINPASVEVDGVACDLTALAW